VRYRLGDYTLERQDKYMIYRALSDMGAASSEVSGDGVAEVEDGGGFHAAASH
jgi:hypothetical protein